tara:strand:- start:12853 stop:13398 length:546 start_codon:yes stop_codon:yes gene_type:complete
MDGGITEIRLILFIGVAHPFKNGFIKKNYLARAKHNCLIAAVRREKMRSIKVKDYMADYVLSFKPETDLFKAIDGMRQRDVSSAPVVDNDGALVGILAQWDCLRRMVHGSYFEEAGGPVRDYMQTELFSISPEDDVLDVAEMMVERQWHPAIPVLKAGKLVGVLSCSDILQMVRDFELKRQ